MNFLKIALVTVGMALAAGSVTAPAWADGDAAKGKKIFNKCKACHRLEAGKKAIGPSLHGVFGRAAGSLPGYNYSKDFEAARAKGLVWGDETFKGYIENPKKYLGKVLGKSQGRTKMAFAGLKREKDREDLLAFLKQATK